MRTIALQFSARGEVEVVDDGLPRELGPTEVLIETVYSGITNGTERHAMMAEHFWGVFPGRHGYQHVGRIAAVGSAVQGLVPGDWTFNGEYVGHRGWNILDVAAGPLLVKLPESRDYREYALLGVAGVAMKAVRRLCVRPADRVLVTGIGPIGVFAAMAARLHGAEVTVTDLNERRLRIASEQGFDHAVAVSDPDYWDKLKELGPFDAIIDGSGYQRLFYDIFDNGLLAYGGAVCPLAVRLETTFPWSMLHQTDGRIEVSCHFGCDDLRVVIHGIETGVIDPGAIITHTVSIDEAKSIYAVMRDSPGDLFGVVFDWS